MKYRIHFEADGSYWCIQLSTFGLVWTTAVSYAPSMDGPSQQVLKFGSYEEAAAYAVDSGLDNAYAQWHARSIRHELRGQDKKEPAVAPVLRRESVPVDGEPTEPADLIALLPQRAAGITA